MGTKRGRDQAQKKVKVSVMEQFGITKAELFIAWKDYMSCRQIGMNSKESILHASPLMSRKCLEVLACYGLEGLSDIMEDGLNG